MSKMFSNPNLPLIEQDYRKYCLRVFCPAKLVMGIWIREFIKIACYDVYGSEPNFEHASNAKKYVVIY